MHAFLGSALEEGAGETVDDEELSHYLYSVWLAGSGWGEITNIIITQSLDQYQNIQIYFLQY